MKENEKWSFYLDPRQILDNFYACSVTVWQRHFATAEQAYQWKKFSGASLVAKEILAARNPLAVKKISDAHKTEAPLRWGAKKIAVMEEILRAKMDQHQEVRDALEASGGLDIEECTQDSFWGTGIDGQGRNEMGKIWMRLRRELLSGTTGT